MQVRGVAFRENGCRRKQVIQTLIIPLDKMQLILLIAPLSQMVCWNRSLFSTPLMPWLVLKLSWNSWNLRCSVYHVSIRSVQFTFIPLHTLRGPTRRSNDHYFSYTQSGKLSKPNTANETNETVCLSLAPMLARGGLISAARFQQEEEVGNTATERSSVILGCSEDRSQFKVFILTLGVIAGGLPHEIWLAFNDLS